MLILGIDTTEKNINVALLENETVLMEIEEQTERTEDLINAVAKIFKATEKSTEDLKGIGVITGPGGYTGTRSGVAVAKTLSQFLNLPIIGFNKLDAIALSYNKEKAIPMVDIKRNEVYAKMNKDESSIINLDTFIADLNSSSENLILLAYDFRAKADKFNTIPNNIQVDFDFYLKPSMVARLASASIKNGTLTYFNDISPFYIREAI